MKSAKPHPLAWKMGVGPPIAPPNWRWRAGKLWNNMYFYTPAPDEYMIGSKLMLMKVLERMPNAPSMDKFCWRITQEIAARPDLVYEEAKHKFYWYTGEEKSGSLRAISQHRKRSANDKASSPSPCVGTRQPRGDVDGHNDSLRLTPRLAGPGYCAGSKDQENVKSLEEKISLSSGTLPAISTWNGTSSYLDLVPCLVGSSSSPSSAEETHRNKKLKQPGTYTPKLFTLILEDPLSFKWLYDTKILADFLEDAQKVMILRPSEMERFRMIIQGRKESVSNLMMYHNIVLRAFIELLGGKAHPAMNRDDLVDLFVGLKGTEW